jgi:hypothetical protein
VILSPNDNAIPCVRDRILKWPGASVKATSYRPGGLTLYLPILHLLQTAIRQCVLPEETLGCHITRQVRAVSTERVFGREDLEIGLLRQVVDEFAKVAVRCIESDLVLPFELGLQISNSS